MNDEPTPDPEARPSSADRLETSPSRTAYEHLSYILSLPERVVRGGSSLVGGVAREGAELLIPQSFQSSRTYSTMVRQMLDFMVHDVGGVPTGDATSATVEVDNYVARKAVGNFLDMASMATLHLSPLVILAAVSDVAYGSQNYLRELADELMQQGVIDSDSRIEHVNDLLGAVSRATAKTSEVFDTPPLSLDGLRQTLAETRSAIAGDATGGIPSKAKVEQMWRQMRAIADREGVDLLAVGGATTIQSLSKFATVSRGALSSVRVAGRLFDKHVLDHYAQAIDEIQSDGLYRSVATSCQPYLAAVWENFRPSRATVTESLLSGQLLSAGLRALRVRWESTASSAGAALPDSGSAEHSPQDDIRGD